MQNKKANNGITGKLVTRSHNMLCNNGQQEWTHPQRETRATTSEKKKKKRNKTTAKNINTTTLVIRDAKNTHLCFVVRAAFSEQNINP